MILRARQKNSKLILGNNQKKGVQQISDFWNAQLSGNEHQFIKNVCPRCSWKLMKQQSQNCFSPLWNQRPLSLGRWIWFLFKIQFVCKWMTKLSVPQDGASSACSYSGRRGHKKMFHFSSSIDHAINMCTIKNEIVKIAVETSARYQQKNSWYSQ